MATMRLLQGCIGMMEKKVETTILGLGFRVLPLCSDHNRDPKTKTLTRRGFINHGSPYTPYISLIEPLYNPGSTLGHAEAQMWI